VKECNVTQSEQEFKPGKVARGFNVLFSCPTDLEEGGDRDRHFRNSDFAAQESRSRNQFLT